VASPARAEERSLRGPLAGVDVGGGWYFLSGGSSGEWSGDDFDAGAVVTGLRFGGGISDEVAIVARARLLWFDLDDAAGESLSLASGVHGLGVLIHPDLPSNRWFFSGTLGAASLGSLTDSRIDTWWGFGFEVGVGYEIVPHWAGEFGVAVGTPSASRQSGVQTIFYGITFAISGLAY
jgi:hypothetical protein